jgi:hypothetical protein
VGQPPEVEEVYRRVKATWDEPSPMQETQPALEGARS